MATALLSRPVDRFLPFGGRLCLDFANTVNGRLTPAPDDLLVDAADLAAWGRRIGLLPQADAARLAAEWADDSSAAGAWLACARALRETIYSIFAAIASGGQPSRADVSALMDAYRTALAETQLVAGTDSGPWRRESTPADPPRPLGWLVGPVARSAMDLLTSADLGRLKRCAGADRGCAGLFVDETKNGIRRWCRMDDCGSRSKMRRLYARRRATRAGES